MVKHGQTVLFGKNRQLTLFIGAGRGGRGGTLDGEPGQGRRCEQLQDPVQGRLSYLCSCHISLCKILYSSSHSGKKFKMNGKGKN